MVYIPESLEKSPNTPVIPNCSSSTVPADRSIASSSEAGSSTSLGQSIALKSTNGHMSIKNEEISAMESATASTRLLDPALNICKPLVEEIPGGVAQKTPLQTALQAGSASVQSQEPETKVHQPIIESRPGMTKSIRRGTLSSGRSCGKRFGKLNIESGLKPGLVPLSTGSSLNFGFGQAEPTHMTKLDLTQRKPNTTHTTNQKPMDPHLKHFLTASPSLLVGDLPAEAQEFLSSSQATIANYLAEMKQVRTLIDSADKEMHFVNSHVTQVISSVIDTDQCIQADANQHMETEKKCLRKANLQQIQLIFDSIRSNLDVPFKAKDHALTQIKNTVDLAFLAAQRSFKMLESASLDLAYLEGIASNYSKTTLLQILTI
ncbi:hypothetical protein DSO57_1006902 [Entomophthora muscae]|uniref:Uncharacterized protein n=1 Tax=Entomophthora muscae TaxID=34485 RepID=A0ACC2U578_9FUNG|nr:hypothetical protein DSO57_1006902 [Entomophthora muscae]